MTAIPRTDNMGSWECKNWDHIRKCDLSGVRGQRVTSQLCPYSCSRLGSKRDTQQPKVGGTPKPCLPPALAWRLCSPHPPVRLHSISHRCLLFLDAGSGAHSSLHLPLLPALWPWPVWSICHINISPPEVSWETHLSFGFHLCKTQ